VGLDEAKPIGGVADGSTLLADRWRDATVNRMWTRGVAALVMVTVAHVALAATVRVSGDNTWKVFHDGELIAESVNWQAPTVTDFDLDKAGRALIAIYVHDAEPGGAGVGGMLADIQLDDGTYIPTTVDEPGWVCDFGDPIADRNDDWETVNFDDSAWIPLTFYEPFGQGVWGFGAAAMTAAFGDPEVVANWCWCMPNNETDEVYFHFRIGSLAVEATGKIATTWSTLKAAL
jgi:alpha-L-rhamnosidase